MSRLMLAFILTLVGSYAAFPGCSLFPSDEPKDDPCATKSSVHSAQTIHKDGRYDLVTPSAMKSCHATFRIRYAWKNLDKKMRDDTTPPLEWRFQVFPGMFIMVGIPAPTKRWEASTVDPWFGYSYSATLSAGAKDQPDPFVNYQIEAMLKENVNDSILVEGTIEYAPWNGK